LKIPLLVVVLLISYGVVLPKGLYFLDDGVVAFLKEEGLVLDVVCLLACIDGDGGNQFFDVGCAFSVVLP